MALLGTLQGCILDMFFTCNIFCNASLSHFQRVPTRSFCLSWIRDHFQSSQTLLQRHSCRSTLEHGVNLPAINDFEFKRFGRSVGSITILQSSLVSLNALYNTPVHTLLLRNAALAALHPSQLRRSTSSLTSLARQASIGACLIGDIMSSSQTGSIRLPGISSATRSDYVVLNADALSASLRSLKPIEDDALSLLMSIKTGQKKTDIGSSGLTRPDAPEEHTERSM